MCIIKNKQKLTILEMWIWNFDWFLKFCLQWFLYYLKFIITKNACF